MLRCTERRSTIDGGPCMELKTCEYCGTAYDARLRQCPLCGRAAAGQTGSAEPERTAAAPEKAAQSAPAPERPAPGRRLRQEPGAPKAARGYAGKRLRTGAASKPSDVQSTAGASPYAIPKWTMIVLCVILGAGRRAAGVQPPRLVAAVPRGNTRSACAGRRACAAGARTGDSPTACRIGAAGREPIHE